jgi:hypothetical protein
MDGDYPGLHGRDSGPTVYPSETSNHDRNLNLLLAVYLVACVVTLAVCFL